MKVFILRCDTLTFSKVYPRLRKENSAKMIKAYGTQTDKTEYYISVDSVEKANQIVKEVIKK